MADFTTNYTGRSVDIYIMDLPEPAFEGQAGLTFKGSIGGKVCAGVQKLAQIYLITLLTAVHSKLLAPTEGTILGTLSIGASNVSRSTLQHIVSISHAETLASITTEQGDLAASGLEAVPDDEILVDAAIFDFAIQDCSSFSFSVLLTAASGDVTTFVVPLSLVP